MPFANDEQRKAAFAHMKGGSRRGSGSGHFRSNYDNTSPRPPKTPRPKKPKTPRAPKSTTVSYGNGAVGYAGNYTVGLPNWSNVYQMLPNTTAATPELAGYSGSIQGDDVFSIASQGSGWDPSFLPYGARILSNEEKIGLGIPIAIVAAWWLIPEAVALTGGEVVIADVVLPLTTSNAITVYGAQGAALGWSALALTDYQMSIIDAPRRTRNADGSYTTQYVDFVSWFQAQPKGWIPRGQ